MRKDRWGVFVCSCEGELTLDQERLSKCAPLVQVSDHPDQGAGDFARRAAEEGVSRAMIACCRGLEPFQEAFREAGTLASLHHLDLKHRCYLPHAAHEDANGKAARLLKGAMLAAERAGAVTEFPFEAGNRLLMVIDGAEGLKVAQRLQTEMGVILVAEGKPGSLEGMPAEQVNWARLIKVEGRLGAFTVTLAPINAQGKLLKEKTLQSDQVLVIRENDGPPIPSRTGIHLLPGSGGLDSEQVAAEVSALSGAFMKPELLSYSPAICAGGSAQHQTCGRCIDYCPYDAIARDPNNPLRVRVDHFACEGCGACTSACPTGAMAYTDPNPAQVYNQMAGMLTAFGDAGPFPLPQVVAFHCPEQGAAALELAGREPLEFTPGIFPLEVPCLRSVSIPMMLAAFKMGAAGVALLGCEACPHGERELLNTEFDLTRRILDAFGLGGERLRLFTGEPGTLAEAIGGLDGFARQLESSPIKFQGRTHHAATSRAVLADALATLIEQTGREPGGLPLKAGEPFALPDVAEEGCTLCRACANACPTHAFRFDPNQQTLSLKHIECVACGLCEQVCPENVITLRKELYLESGSLEWQVVVEDETIRCPRCEKPFINKKALEIVESRVLDLKSLLDTFDGNRRELLRMCPDCRAVDAMFEVERGWEP